KPEFVILCILGIAVSACLLVGRVVKAGFLVYDLQFALFTSGILFGLFFLVGPANLSLPWLLRRTIGSIASFSYSLYLVHYPVLTIFALYLPSPSRYDPSKFLMVFLVANLVGLVFWYAFERHHHVIAQFAKSVLDRRRPRPATQSEIVGSVPRG